MNGTHNFELKDVPTTLNWEGGLFPTAKSPRVSNTPMTGTFRVKDSVSLPGHQRSARCILSFLLIKGTIFDS